LRVGRLRASVPTVEVPPGFMNASRLESEAKELTGFVAVELDPLSMLR
jgi:hypothetical protein